jgi:hypothetical protein
MAAKNGETTKALRIPGIPALLVPCVGIAVGHDAAHDVDKAATKTGHVVKHATTKVGNATKGAEEPRSTMLPSWGKRGCRIFT